MSIRMMSVSFVFSSFLRVVRDTAGKLSKQVELKTEGESTELDKSLIEKLTDPLIHLVRNSLDHGIEAPDTRMQPANLRTAHLHFALSSKAATSMSKSRTTAPG
jgi:two-component system, chemotaxis family, sensor kinase CheA